MGGHEKLRDKPLQGGRSACRDRLGLTGFPSVADDGDVHRLQRIDRSTSRMFVALLPRLSAGISGIKRHPLVLLRTLFWA